MARKETPIPQTPAAAPQTPPPPASASAGDDSGNGAYVFSTLANSQKYIDWVQGGGDMSIAGRAVVIAGGTGVANGNLVTPLGVATRVDAQELALLQRNALFMLHQKNGFITVRASKSDPEKVAVDMNRSDPASPKTPANWAGAGEGEATPAGVND